ncbi:MAG: TPM domain-containing protein [Lachnospiraceae bacterium]|nr:TPM domain-containing protein [Lachnospiraceae bacterium]
MKKFVQIFKIPLLVFTVLLVVGVVCKIIKDSRPPIEFVRGNTQTATDERVFDVADKLTDEEEAVLREKIQAAEDLCGIDIVVVILNQSLEEYAKSYESIIGYVEPYQYTMVYADNFYEDGMFGYDAPYGDGVILVDNWYREADGGVYSWVDTSGKVQNLLRDSDVEFILDTCLDYVDDDPAYAYGYFVELMADYLDPNQNWGDALGGIFSILVGLMAGLIFFFVNFGGKKGKNTVETRTYVKNGKAEVRAQQDIFLTKTIQKRKIETDTNRSSGGSGGHISAGGHSYGGGGHRR